MSFELIALLCAGLFAGASIYVSVVEHPARLGAGTDIALAQWRPSYKRAAIMQSLLAVSGLFGAVAAYVSGRGMPALVGGLLLIFAAPWTLIVIMPTNRQLLDPSRTAATHDTAALLDKWGKLHAVRTVASLLSLCVLGAHIAGYL
jgi:hypothetical protein